MLTYLFSDTTAEARLEVGALYPYSRPMSVPAGEEGAVAYLPAESESDLLQLVYFTPLPEEDKRSWATQELQLTVYQSRHMLTHVVTQIEGMGCFEAIPRLPKQRDEHVEGWAQGQGRGILLILVDTYTGRVCSLREVTAPMEWATALRSAVTAQMEQLPAELIQGAMEEDSQLPLWQMMAASRVHMTTSPRLKLSDN